MARRVLEVADIFRAHGPAWREANAGHVSLGQLKAMSAIETCRTAALGGVAHMRGYPQWRWHLDEAFVKVNGKLCYLWRAVDHEGEVLEAVVTAKRDKAAALKFLKRIMKKYSRPLSVVTNGLCSYPAAMKEIGNADRQEAGRRLNNRAENSHQPFRRRERAMQRFRSMKTLQKFSSVHAQVHNHFNQERHLVTRQVYKQRRSAALAEWSALAA